MLNNNNIMKIKKFVIQYRYSNGSELLTSCLYDSFEDALSQLCYYKEQVSKLLEDCEGVLIKSIEFEL